MSGNRKSIQINILLVYLVKCGLLISTHSVVEINGLYLLCILSLICKEHPDFLNHSSPILDLIGLWGAIPVPRLYGQACDLGLDNKKDTSTGPSNLREGWESKGPTTVNPGALPLCGQELLSPRRVAPLRDVSPNSSGSFACRQGTVLSRERGRHSGVDDTVCSQKSSST